MIALAPLPVSLGDAVSGQAATDYDIIPPGYEFAFGLTVSRNYFRCLGVRRRSDGSWHRKMTHAARTRGRGPRRELWRRRFGGDPTLVGRNIRFNGHRYEVVGIVAKEFVGTQPNVPDFWVPFAMRGQLQGNPDSLYRARGYRSVALYGRLKPQVLSAQATAAINLPSIDVAEGEPRSRESASPTHRRSSV